MQQLPSRFPTALSSSAEAPKRPRCSRRKTHMHRGCLPTAGWPDALPLPHPPLGKVTGGNWVLDAQCSSSAALVAQGRHKPPGGAGFSGRGCGHSFYPHSRLCRSPRRSLQLKRVKDPRSKYSLQVAVAPAGSLQVAIALHHFCQVLGTWMQTVPRQQSRAVGGWL